MGILPIPYINHANPAWLTSLASTKITGTLSKPQQHAQTAYYDQSGTWVETQLFQKPITVRDGAGNDVFDVVTNQIRFRSASAGYLVGPSGQVVAGEDAGGYYYGMGFTTPTKAIYIGQSNTGQIIANAQTINNRTTEFNIIGVDGTGWGAFRAGQATFNGNITFSANRFIYESSGEIIAGSNGAGFFYGNGASAADKPCFIGYQSNTNLTTLHQRTKFNRLATFDAGIDVSSTAKLGDYTVATLPSAASNTGHECNVTDSSVTTLGSTVAGSGSNNVKVRSNGTNWTVTGI